MLRRLEAENFRNLHPLAWEPGAGRHLLLGGNGAGKTSLLEAVYAVATTRSFRTPRLAECVRHGEDGFQVRAEVETAARSTLAVSYDAGPGMGGGGGLDRSVNGERGPLSEHLEVLPVVAWSAADVEIISGPPAERRRFLDRGVVSLRPGALAALRRYRDALGEKRQLLARSTGAGSPPATLETWNRVLAEAAVEVARLRAAYARELDRRLAEVLAEILAATPAHPPDGSAGGVAFPEVTLRYRPSPAEALEGIDALAERLDRSADSEWSRGMPLLGPHRDDLVIAWAGHDADRVTSAGERKALSLALTAAHGRVLTAAGREPVHLLDDLDAELAPDTLAAVWRIFDDATQLVASSNRPTVWEGLAIDRTTHLVSGRIDG